VVVDATALPLAAWDDFDVLLPQPAMNPRLQSTGRLSAKLASRLLQT
jgi:hypothetical protein